VRNEPQPLSLDLAVPSGSTGSWGLDATTLNALVDALDPLFEENLQALKKQLRDEYGFGSEDNPMLELSFNLERTPEALEQLDTRGRVILDPLALGLILRRLPSDLGPGSHPSSRERAGCFRRGRRIDRIRHRLVASRRVAIGADLAVEPIGKETERRDAKKEDSPKQHALPGDRGRGCDQRRRAGQRAELSGPRGLHRGTFPDQADKGDVGGLRGARASGAEREGERRIAAREKCQSVGRPPELDPWLALTEGALVAENSETPQLVGDAGDSNRFAHQVDGAAAQRVDRA